MADVRCQKCGRILKSSRSLAMRIGPICAGISGGSGTGFKLRTKRKSGKSYSSVQPVGRSGTLPLPFFDDEEMRAASEPMALDDLLKLAKNKNRRMSIRQHRRALFEQRIRFAPGMYSKPGRTPIVYEPVGEQDWVCSADNHVISHERLEKYLERYGRI